MNLKNSYKYLLPMAAVLPFSLSVMAQGVNQAPADSGLDFEGIEEIVVTAQKRESNLQETPIAISAFSGSMLEDQDIENAGDIQFAVPNAMVSSNSGYSVRGVGNNAVSATADPGMGVHVNGVYLTASVINIDYYDLESVEVLRGPQGTLFGRNTTAGVLNTVTSKPTDEFEGRITTDVGNYNSLRTHGYVNIPVSDSIGQRFAFSTLERDGYTENVSEGAGFSSLDGREQFSLRSTSSFEFSDKANGFLFAQYSKENSDRARAVGVLCTADPVLGCNNDTLSSQFPNTDFTDGSLANGGLSGLLGALGYGTRSDFYNTNLDGSVRSNPSDPRKVRVDFQPSYKSDDKLVSFELNYDLSDELIFTSVTAYHERSYAAYNDFDNSDGGEALLSPRAVIMPNGRAEASTRWSTVRTDEGSSEQFSQEFRIASYMDGNFNFTAGAFFMSYESESLVNFYLPELTAVADFKALPEELAPFSFQSPEITTDSWAVFSEGYYDFSEDTTLTLGLRYSKEEKEVLTRTISPLDVYPFAPGSYLTSDFDLDSTWRRGDGSWGEMTGKIGLSHTPDLAATDETLFFGSLSRGYKGGGINPGASDSSFPTFEPEYINALEIGTKNTLANRTIQANATLFVYQYDGLQVGGILGDGTTFNTNVDADVKGAEFEFLAMPIEGLRMNLNVSFLDTEISEDLLTSPDISSPSGSDPVNLKGKQLMFSPEKSVQFGVQYTHSFTPEWEVTYRAQIYWQDEYFSRLYNIATDKQDAWKQTDMSVTVRDFADVWEFEAYVKNVSDDASITGLGVDNSLVGRYRTPSYLEPRTYGARVSYRF